MKLFVVAILSALCCCPVVSPAQVSPVPGASAPALTIDLSAPNLPVVSGQLKVGGTNPQGIEINANNRFLTLGGKPWFPIMGEFHYAPGGRHRRARDGQAGQRQ